MVVTAESSCMLQVFESAVDSTSFEPRSVTGSSPDDPASAELKPERVFLIRFSVQLAAILLTSAALVS